MADMRESAAKVTEIATKQGKTTIANAVVAKIAALAAQEVPGVHALVDQGLGNKITGLAHRVVGTDARGQGVNVEVGERETAVDLALMLDYGVNIAQVTDGVRRNVVNRVQAMTGLVVKEVNIDVIDLYFAEDATKKGQDSQRRVE
ncbi:MAG: Asp23/Gls24 family envelope stress response protein [Nitrospirota bacterium]|nr:Asp23/Gls24 family envelope stress response protein [Nitrospirota bacterium]